MKTILLSISALAIALALPGEAATAQTAYPTASSRITVTGTVPLQCNDGVTVCLPPSTANPVPVAVISGGGGGGGGTSGGTATAANPTYTEGSTGRALSLDLSGRLRTLSTQSGTWSVGLAAGSNTIGSVNVVGTPAVAPNVTRGGGAIDGNTQRVTLATDGPGVTALTSIDAKTPALVGGASPVSATLGTSNGWTNRLANGLSTTVVSVKGSAGQLGMLMCWNPNATVAYVQLFNTASGSVTLGSTTPALSIPIAPTSTGGWALANPGINFSTAISMAVTTTATGSTALGTALDCNVVFN